MIASPLGGRLLGGVIGGRKISEDRVERGVNARFPGGDLLREVIGGPGIKEKKKSKTVKKRFPEERCVDSWEVSGQGGVRRRQRRTPRRELFIPHRVAGGPEAGVQVKKIRVTNGTFIKTRRGFQVIDDYNIKAKSHRLLAGAWIGTSEFREVDNFIKDVGPNRKSIAGADCEFEPETQELPQTSGSICSLAPSRRRICSNEVDNSQSQKRAE